jgi:hypothetical protein
MYSCSTWTGQQIGDGPVLRGERPVTRCAGMQPDMVPPRLQAIDRRHPLHGLGRA